MKVRYAYWKMGLTPRNNWLHLPGRCSLEFENGDLVQITIHRPSPREINRLPEGWVLVLVDDREVSPDLWLCS